MESRSTTLMSCLANRYKLKDQWVHNDLFPSFTWSWPKKLIPTERNMSGRRNYSSGTSIFTQSTVIVSDRARASIGTSQMHFPCR